MEHFEFDPKEQHSIADDDQVYFNRRASSLAFLQWSQFPNLQTSLDGAIWFWWVRGAAFHDRWPGILATEEHPLRHFCSGELIFKPPKFSRWSILILTIPNSSIPWQMTRYTLQQKTILSGNFAVERKIRRYTLQSELIYNLLATALMDRIF